MNTWCAHSRDSKLMQEFWSTNLVLNANLTASIMKMSLQFTKLPNLSLKPNNITLKEVAWDLSVFLFSSADLIKESQFFIKPNHRVHMLNGRQMPLVKRAKSWLNTLRRNTKITCRGNNVSDLLLQLYLKSLKEVKTLKFASSVTKKKWSCSTQKPLIKSQQRLKPKRKLPTLPRKKCCEDIFNLYVL